MSGSYVQVLPDSTGRKVETTQQADATGITVERQVVTLGAATEGQILETLLQIRDELRAMRIQNAQAHGVAYEPTGNLMEAGN